ncbi:putative UPF0481 protein At3g02645 [Typha latifolia]|uniref:putative UPF0481 protein At3g02645 n=1 Tax=Typha latifolia TaxID=4733 RepID=UPI003C2C30F8
MVSDLNHPFDELQWVIRIRRILDEEFEIDDDQPITIFDVPKPLLHNKPDAYIPQLIALGPYHHCREELRDMERYKVSAAKRIQNQLSNIKFQQLVDIFINLEHQIRAHYHSVKILVVVFDTASISINHRYLNFNGQTLSWMMAIDASFLLEYLQIYATTDDKNLRRIASRMSHLVDSGRRTSSQNMLLRDVVMLENQIPLFLLQKLLEVIYSQNQTTAEEMLSTMLIGFLKEVSPFNRTSSPQSISATQYSHLLQLLYHNIVPKSEESYETIEVDDQSYSRMKQALNELKEFVFNRCIAFASVILKFVLKIPLRIITSLPAFSIIKHPVEQLLFSQGDQRSSQNNAHPSNDHNTQPLLEEIAVPSVSELSNAGVKFSPTSGDLSTIQFCEKTATLNLPEISLDINSEVILRNLVAYEASIGCPSLSFSRYVEFMNGIIDTAKDAEMLRKAGVVVNHLKSDKEVAELWNGMTRSVRLTRVPSLDKVIQDVNKYYHSRWRVRIGKFMKRYMASSWDCLVLLVVVVVLLVMSTQAFCVAFGCIAWSRRRRIRP